MSVTPNDLTLSAYKCLFRFKQTVFSKIQKNHPSKPKVTVTVVVSLMTGSQEKYCPVKNDFTLFKFYDVTNKSEKNNVNVFRTIKLIVTLWTYVMLLCKVDTE